MRLWKRAVAVFRAHFGAEHCLPFSCEQYPVCLPFVCVPCTLLLCNALDATSSWLKALQGSKVILSVAPVSTCVFITTFEHGSGAFVLTCGCYWIMVSMECATGEMSGYWYCGEVTQIRSMWMRLQEMEPSCC